jgi:hypothetical protein
MIPKHEVVKTASKIFTLVFLGSLVLWLCGDIMMINPFVSILGLVSCPFFHGIGKMLEKGR